MTHPLKHAKFIHAWADGEDVQIFYKTAGEWVSICGSHSWCDHNEYRFKPKMITVGEYSFPEPMRVAPAIRQEVWLTTLTGAEPVQWSNNPVKEHWLKLGLIHDYKVAAEAHTRALIALTEARE